MLAAIEIQTPSRNWTTEAGRFIPKPEKWLEDEQWLDKLQPVGAGVPQRTRAKCDPYDQQAKTREVDRLVREGLSRAEAQKRVGW